MCAINGFNWEDGALVDRMNLVTKHRGPDATSKFLSSGYSLGHNRLSIIETSHASDQPMKSSDGKLVIVYNGELYNYKEIKKEIGSDYKFTTESDTEVILASYKKWGSKMLERFNGMFAFVILDLEKKELFLARDSSGVKPLYYFWDKGKFIFSSEIKGILEHKLKREFNKQSLSLYLNLLYVPGTETMFSGISKLAPSSYATLKNGSFQLSKFKPYMGSDNSNKSLPDIMDEVVRRQMVSDRPLGLYLSGGLDSSILLHSMSKYSNQVKTFSVGFDIRKDEEADKFNADFFLARKTAGIYKTDHTEVMVKPSDVMSTLEKAVFHLDEPVSSVTTIPMLILSGLAKKQVDVVLSGDGGDELFGGYERYRLSKIIDIYRKFPSFLKTPMNILKVGRKLNTEPGVSRIDRFMFQDRQSVEKVIDGRAIDLSFANQYFSNNFPYNVNDFDSATRHLMEVDRKTWLVDEALLRSDKLSMANGLEVRVPFLDNALIEYSRKIPTDTLVGVLTTKKFVRESYRGILPDYLISEPKRGWFSPASKWLRNSEIDQRVREILFDQDIEFVNMKNLESIYEDHINMRGYHLNTIWSILTLMIWKKEFKMDIN